MPVVLRVDGFSFRVIPEDHDPPHVHVRYAGASAILNIVSEAVRDAHGMKDPDLRRAQKLVGEHREELLEAWLAIQAQVR